MDLFKPQYTGLVGVADRRPGGNGDRMGHERVIQECVGVRSVLERATGGDPGGNTALHKAVHGW